MSPHDPDMQPPRDRDATSAANPDADPAQQEWARTEALAAGVPEAELDAQTATGDDQASDEDMPTAEDQPETQGTEPLIAELGRRGEGELGPNPLMH